VLSKNQKRGKCPFRNFKDCSPKCVFCRKGVRYNEKTHETFPVEDCAINIIADNLETLHQRAFAVQKEMGETKNATVFQAMAILADSAQAREELKRIIANQFKETQRLR